MPQSREALDLLAPDVMASAHPRWRAASPQAGAAWGGFLVWPSVGIGGLADSNPLQRAAPHAATGGVRLTPRFVAERETGVHATVLYGAAEARLYPTRPEADQLDGRIGLMHDWAPRRDLIVRLQAEAAQARDRVDSRAAVTGDPHGSPLTSRDASLAASVQKRFNVLFLSLGTGLVRTGFANGATRAITGTPALSAETRTDLQARLGARFGPALFAFAEPAANWRVLDAAPARSHGSRIVAGIGVERLGLLSGEAYAGLQHQDYTLRPRGIAEPVFGARLNWIPSLAWSVTAEAGRGLEQAAVGTAAQPLGTPVEVTQESVTLRAMPSRAWSGEFGLRHARLLYLGHAREDDLLGLDGNLTIPWRHDLDLLAELELTRVRSSLVAASYRRAAASLGLRYRY